MTREQTFEALREYIRDLWRSGMVNEPNHYALIEMLGRCESAPSEPTEPTQGMVERMARALARHQINRNHQLEKRPDHDADFFQRAEDFAWPDFVEEARAVFHALPLQDHGAQRQAARAQLLGIADRLNASAAFGFSEVHDAVIQLRIVGKALAPAMVAEERADG